MFVWEGNFSLVLHCMALPLGDQVSLNIFKMPVWWWNLKKKKVLVPHMAIFLSITICCPLVHLCANLSHFMTFFFSYVSYVKLFRTFTIVGMYMEYLLFAIALASDNTVFKPKYLSLLWVKLCSTALSSRQADLSLSWLVSFHCCGLLLFCPSSNSCLVCFGYKSLSAWTHHGYACYLFCPHVEQTAGEVFKCSVKWLNRTSALF